MMGVEIVPSLLSADFTRLGEQIKILEKAGAKRIHLDIMDGHFVPNITFGPPMVTSIRKATPLHLESHLMITNPEKFIDPFAKAGSNTILVHAEIGERVRELLQKIKEYGISAGLVVNPETPIDEIKNQLQYVDHLLIMTVNPGFGAQKMIMECLDKVRYAKEYRDSQRLKFYIEVDGGINDKTIVEAIDAGVDLIVAGNAVFKNDSPYENFKLLERIVSEKINER